MELTANHLQEILTILSELDPEQVMERVVHIIPRVFHSKACALFLTDAENEDEIILRKTSHQKILLSPERITYEKGEGLTGWVFKHRTPLLLTDLDIKNDEDLRAISPDLSFKGKYADVGLQRPKSYLGAPLISSKGECLGVLRMSADDTNFSTQDMDIMVSLAAYVSLAIEKARLFIHEKRKSEYFTLLTSIGTKLHTYFNRQELLNFISRGCADTFSSETCEIYTRSDDDPELLVLRAGHGIPAGLINTARHQVGEGLTGFIVKEGRVLRSRNVLTLPHHKGKYRNAIKGTLKHGDRLTFMGMPIRIKSDIIGCIKLYNKIPTSDGIPFFTEDDEKFMGVLVDMLAVALENLQYLESMQISAIKMMQIQRLTALGTLAIRVPNEISNPLTVARLNVINLLRSMETMQREGAVCDIGPLYEKVRTVQQFLDEVSKGIKILQEFSTKAGFVKTHRTWSELIDESLLFLSSDLLSKKVKITRSKDVEKGLPEFLIEPNEGIEILVTLLKGILDGIAHYDSEIAIEAIVLQESSAVSISLEGRDNAVGTPLHSSLAGLSPLPDRNFFNPSHFALKVAEEIVRNNYGGRIECERGDNDRVKRFQMILPIERSRGEGPSHG